MNSTKRFIGDIHSDYSYYLLTIDKTELETIQVGDFGIGFNRNPIDMYNVSKHRFIRGNHDYPLACKYEPNWIPDGHVELIEGTFDSVMYIGGAYSIDKEWRLAGVDWWPDEELSYEELNILIDQWMIHKPKVLIAHEVPQFLTAYFGRKIYDIPSRTRDAFDQMFKYHVPKLMISGHWHFPFDQVVNGCRHIILDCNHYIDINLAGDCLENIQTCKPYRYIK